MLISLAAHLALVAALSLSPEPEPFVMPASITVDLVASLPSAAPPPKAAVAPPPEPAAKPVPAAPPKPKVKILPKKAPSATAKPRVPPKPEPVVRRERPKELSYDDALAQLRSEMGESTPQAPVQQSAQAAPTARANPTGIRVSPEVLAWNNAVKTHIRSNLITLPEFRESGLAAVLEVNVAVDGRVLGQPKLARSSGNPFYDDNALRAVLKSSPLPAPPAAGTHTIIFTSEE
jgi:TonB family protein